METKIGPIYGLVGSNSQLRFEVTNRSLKIKWLYTANGGTAPEEKEAYFEFQYDYQSIRRELRLMMLLMAEIFRD